MGDGEDSRGRLLLNSLLNQVQNALIISMGLHIYQDQCLKQNTVINRHPALLPLHKGMYAYLFAIYQGDSATGSTWHKVTSDLDGGEILAQKLIPISPKISSLSLLTKTTNAAIDTLTEALDNLEAGISFKPDLSKVVEYAAIKKEQMHRAKDIFAINSLTSEHLQNEKACQRFLATFNFGLTHKECPSYVPLAGEKHVIVSGSIKDHVLKLVTEDSLKLEYVFPQKEDSLAAEAKTTQ